MIGAFNKDTNIEKAKERVMQSKYTKVLVVSKDSESKGGITNYINLFFKKFRDDHFELQKFEIGSRAQHYHVRLNRKIGYFVDYLKDIAKFIRLMTMSPEIGVVHLNPSLIPVPLFRDGILLFLVKHIFKRSTVVLIHGWSDKTAATIDNYTFLAGMFCYSYKKADHIVVLCEDFAQMLIKWGIDSRNITVSKTMFDGGLVNKREHFKSGGINFIYLGRISEPKGVFTIIEACAILKKMHNDFVVNFFGHGATKTIIGKLKAKAKHLGVDAHCIFYDFVDEQKKYRVYAEADVFLLPTYHPEGCPTTVLEALASGLMVISTNIGALKEVIQDGINGFIIEAKNPKQLSEKMAWTLDYQSELDGIALRNIKYAFGAYESEIIIQKIKDIYRKVINK